MPRMYHPDHGGAEDVPDDDACIAVLKESGWKLAPEPEAAEPGLLPEPVTYEPVTKAKPPKDEKSEAKPKRSKPADESDADQQSKET